MHDRLGLAVGQAGGRELLVVLHQHQDLHRQVECAQPRRFGWREKLCEMPANFSLI